jgi:hypothetical protein
MEPQEDCGVEDGVGTDPTMPFGIDIAAHRYHIRPGIDTGGGNASKSTASVIPCNYRLTMM